MTKLNRLVNYLGMFIKKKEFVYCVGVPKVFGFVLLYFCILQCLSPNSMYISGYLHSSNTDSISI